MYFGFYLTRYSFSAAKGSLDLPYMDEATMGLIDSLFLISYAVGQFIWGALADRLGPKRVVLVGLTASIVLSIAMGASAFLTAFLVINLLQGLAQSSGWAPLAKNLSSWFSRRERGQVLGWWLTNYAAGSVVALALAGGAISLFGHWSYAFYVPAACLLAISLLYYFFHADRPQNVGLPSIDAYHGELEIAAQPTKTAPAETVSWLELIRQPMIGLLAATYFLLKPTRYAILLWGPYYVALKLQSGAFFSATITTSFAIAGVFGAIVAGTISDRFFKARRMPFTVICLLILSVILFAFDDLVGRTVAHVNRTQLKSASVQLEMLSRQHGDADLQSVSVELAAIAERNSLSDPDAIGQLRDATERLRRKSLPSFDAQVLLRSTIIELRKLVRSEQFALLQSADMYTDRIKRIERRVKTFGLDGTEPLLSNLQRLLNIKRFEIAQTVVTLSLVINDMQMLALERQDLGTEIAQMAETLRHIRSEISDYLEDRGDDMSFLYQEQFRDLRAAAKALGLSHALIDRLDELADRATLMDRGDSAIDRRLDEVKAIVPQVPDESFATRIDASVTALEFERRYRPLRPPESMSLAHWAMVVSLFLIGFFLYAPDSQISGVAAVDFGHHKGASSAAGFINGCGAVAAIFGGAGVGIVAQAFSWNVLFSVFASMTLLAALLLLPKWNAIPTAEAA